MEKKKKQIIYIHGATAFSSYDRFLDYLRTTPVSDPSQERSLLWPEILRSELGESFEVLTPAMPNKQNAHYEEWKIWFERHFSFLNEEVILLGWSQGGYFLAKYLCENNFPKTILALNLIAAPIESADFQGEDGGDFSFDTTTLGNLASQVLQVNIWHSKDDPLVPFSHAEKYLQALPTAQLFEFKDRNHFIQPSFPELVAKLREAA